MLSSKPGHFWELEAWMAENDISVREMALLTGIKKSALSRILCGQFVRVDPDDLARISKATNKAIDQPQWAEFLQRRLSERQQVA